MMLSVVIWEYYLDLEDPVLRLFIHNARTLLCFQVQNVCTWVKVNACECFMYIVHSVYIVQCTGTVFLGERTVEISGTSF